MRRDTFPQPPRRSSPPILVRIGARGGTARSAMTPHYTLMSNESPIRTDQSPYADHPCERRDRRQLRVREPHRVSRRPQPSRLITVQSPFFAHGKAPASTSSRRSPFAASGHKWRLSDGQVPPPPSPPSPPLPWSRVMCWRKRTRPCNPNNPTTERRRSPAHLALPKHRCLPAAKVSAARSKERPRQDIRPAQSATPRL